MYKKRILNLITWYLFFGAKITGQTFDYGNGAAASILDNRAGTGKQWIKKKAQAPLFKPTANMGWSHGAPNMSDFYQSRVNPSRKISNNKPWEEERVGTWFKSRIFRRRYEWI